MMTQPKRPDTIPPVHQCPACHRPQTKIRRRLSDGTLGSTTAYVCTHVSDCSVGINLTKVETWGTA
jgi:hypothetical protein